MGETTGCRQCLGSFRHLPGLRWISVPRHPGVLRIRQISGGSADSGLITTPLNALRNGDWYFFDLTATPGYVFVISGVNEPAHASNGTGAITFDRVSAVPVSITTTSLPDATQEASYSTQLAAADGTPPYSWSATGLPGGLSVSTGGIIVPFQDCVLIQEDVQRSRNPNAAFRLWDSKTLFQKVRVGGVHLEAVDSLAAFTPPLLGHLPAEIEHPHSFATIAPNTVFVLCPFGAEVLV